MQSFKARSDLPEAIFGPSFTRVEPEPAAQISATIQHRSVAGSGIHLTDAMLEQLAAYLEKRKVTLLLPEGGEEHHLAAAIVVRTVERTASDPR